MSASLLYQVNSKFFENFKPLRGIFYNKKMETNSMIGEVFSLCHYVTNFLLKHDKITRVKSTLKLPLHTMIGCTTNTYYRSQETWL